MRNKDLKLLWAFVLRTEMFTGKASQGRINSFLIGYEAGTDGKCDFIEILSDSIKNEFSIEKRATGWDGQIVRLAEKLNMDWTSVFKKQSLKILTSRFNEETNAEFVDSFIKRIVSKVINIDNHFKKEWIIDWLGVCDLSADWFKKIWTEDEFWLIKKIDEELKGFGSAIELSKKIEPTIKLKNLCVALLKEIEKRASQKK